MNEYTVAWLVDADAWEFDWIRTLLQGFNFDEVFYSPDADLDADTLLKLPGLILVYHHRANVSRFVENYPHHCRILIHLSDEESLTYPRYYSAVDLVLRQFVPHDQPARQNVIEIPLGYKTGFLDDFPTLIPAASNRKFSWTFSGNATKASRAQMLAVFERLARGSTYPTAKHFGGVLSTKPYRDALLQSTFAPCPAGDRLECFRHYEASACGAIPIVQGKKVDILRELRHLKDPPWIFCDSWEEGLAHACELLRTPRQLDCLQQDCLSWWGETVSKLQLQIRQKVPVSL